ncbi:MAG TPA: hypothetical protein ACFE0H_01460 [Elainellaceae cyanobacterium]
MNIDRRLDALDERLLRLTEIFQEGQRESEQRRRDFEQQIQEHYRQTRESSQAIARQFEMLIHQIGVFTEGLTEIRLTAERQERNIDRLVGIVETLVQPPSH